MAEVSQLTDSETSCDESVTTRKARTRKKQKLIWPWTSMAKQKILREPMSQMGKAKVSQLPKTETSCHVSIAIQNDRKSKEQKIPRVPRQLLEKVVEISQLAKTETSCHVSIDIQKDHASLKQKLSLPWKTKPEQKILRVPHQLRKVNEKAYEPYIISIGPYHRGKDHLKEMEEQKVRSLKRLLRQKKQSVEIYLSAMEKIVQKARKCYSEPLDISMEEFVEMMVLDGCFIIQFFMETLEDSFYDGLIYTSILRDLVLVENQLPFFVLQKLWDNIFIYFPPINQFIDRILGKFKDVMPGLKVDPTYNDNSIMKVKHLVHLLHSNWIPSDKAMDVYQMVQPKDGNWRFIRCATELREAGIEFKMVETEGDVKRSLFDIEFKKGILEMPKVTIQDDTESLYRNLIACEQFDISNPAFLTEYVTLMDSLINSGRDVELLCKKKIIDNWLGDDESVAVLFNRLRDHTNLSRENFFYAQLFNDVIKHHETPCNARNAKLRHNYFNSPWAFISVLAATLLLLLAVIQTIFTVFFPS